MKKKTQRQSSAFSIEFPSKQPMLVKTTQMSTTEWLPWPPCAMLQTEQNQNQNRLTDPQLAFLPICCVSEPAQGALIIAEDMDDM